MPEDTGGLSPDRLDDALDLVLDQDPADRLEFILSEFADEPDLADRLIALVQSGQAGGEMLAVADHAAQRLLDASDEVAQETAEEVALPESIGPYRVLDRLGSGGMGTVYLAERHDGEMDRKVALKVITGAAHRLEIQRRFIAERLILSRLEHPNVARLYDVGVDDLGAPFFVMEYVDGVPIDECADKSALSVDHRLALIRQVTDALSYAHANLVVHRDVKPSNILVTRDGVVKLLDFGVAKLLDDESSGGAPLTRPGAAVLTPEYASPEQIRGEAVTTATDVYATGVLLYELLTGIRPYEFSSRSPVHIERIVSQQDPKAPSTVALDASDQVASDRGTSPTRLSRMLAGDLDAILLTALRKEPRARYGSIQELASDLDRYRRREPIRARAPTWRYRAGRFASRHRASIGAAALVVIALVSGLGTTWWQARIATRQAERAERVKELLVGLFEGADPDVAAGEDLTAIDLLSRGEEALLAGLQDEPEISAELQQIVGSIYMSLGAYDRAAPLLETSLELRDEFSAADERAQARSALADLRYSTGEYAEGERIAREVLDLRRASYPEASPEVGAALTDLATFVQNQGRYEEAESILREGLAIDRSVGTPELVATDLNNLGTLVSAMSRYDEAIEVLEESVAIRRESHSGDHTDVATSTANLAWALNQKGEYERADSLYEATLAMRRRLLGDDHPLVAMVLNNQADMRRAEGRLDESRSLHNEALRIRRAVFGGDHADVAASVNNLGIVSFFTQDYDEAAGMFREALRVFRLHRSEDHPHVLTTVSNLGAVLRAQGDFDGAETLIRSTLETRMEVLGAEHHDTGGSWNNLGAILRRQGREGESEEAIRRAVEIFRNALDPSHPDLADALVNLGRTLVTMGRGDEWIEELAESCRISTERFGADHLNVADCRAVLGLAQLDAGDADQAFVELSAAIERLEEDRAEDPWTMRAREALDALSGS